MSPELYIQFAKYNSLMNVKLYNATLKLSPEDRIADKGAFFKSVQKTLQHIMVADIVWLGRFSSIAGLSQVLDSLPTFPTIKSLDQELFVDFQKLFSERQRLDLLIQKFVKALTPEQANSMFTYKNMAGKTFNNPVWVCVSHFFNHQTHHRGQTTTLLTQMGVDVGVTDFVHVITE
jgi:uncharacterized damage-inducible protein DinB